MAESRSAPSEKKGEKGTAWREAEASEAVPPIHLGSGASNGSGAEGCLSSPHLLIRTPPFASFLEAGSVTSVRRRAAKLRTAFASSNATLTV